MKKFLLSISFLFCAVMCFAQYPLQQSIGSKNTQVTTQGALASDSGYVYRYNFPDTIVANRGFLKNIPGIVLRINDTLWQRNNAATKWIKTGSGGGSTNIFSEGLITNLDTVRVNFIDSLRIDSLDVSWPIEGWGNSLTFGFGTNAGGYTAFLTSYLRNAVYNGGVSGENAAQIKARYVAAVNKHDWGAIFWIGRNNLPPAGNINSARSEILGALAQMVDTLEAHNNNRYLILSLTNGGGEGIGTAVYDTIIAINTTIAALYPGHYADIRAWLVANYNPAIPADVTNHAADIPPLSLRIDSVHFNDSGYKKIAQYIYGNFQYTISDTSYTDKVFDANMNVNLLKGRMSNINLGVNGYFSIGGQAVAYVPSRLVSQGSIFFGDGGLLSTGSFNTGAGVGSMLALTTGTSNTAYGYNSLTALTTGTNNTAIGRNAGLTLTTASQNTFVGYLSGLAMLTGSENTAVGSNALLTSSTGTRNVAIGALSQFVTSTGADNTAIGHGSLSSNTTGSRNTALGGSTLLRTTTGNENIGIGQQTGSFNTTGSGNIFIGYRSGWDQAAAGGAVSNNTVIGYQSLLRIGAAANNNIVIGANTASASTFTGDNAIMIGLGLEPPTTSTDDYGSIGNLIFAIGGFGTGTTVGNGRIGIKTASPDASAALDIASTTSGFLTPRMTTTQQNAISSPATGLLIFNTDSAKHCYYTGSAWVCYGSGGGGGGIPTFDQVLNAGSVLTDTYEVDGDGNNFLWNSFVDYGFEIDGDFRIIVTSELNLSAGDSIRIVGVDESATTGLYIALLNPATGALTKVAASDFSGTTIYNGDGSLTSNRTVDGDGNSLLFDNVTTFGANATTSLNFLAGDGVEDFIDFDIDATTATFHAIDVTSTQLAGFEVSTLGGTTNIKLLAVQTGTFNNTFDVADTIRVLGNITYKPGDTTAYQIVVRNEVTGALATSHWPTGGGGGSTTWNGITNPTGNLSLSFDDAEVSSFANGSNTETFWTTVNNSLTTGTSYRWETSSMTTGNLLNIVSTSTALAAGNEGLNIDISGANGTNAITATGLRISVTNTNATSGTNIAALFSASGATTANLALSTGAGGTNDGRILINNATFDANFAATIRGVNDNGNNGGLKITSNNQAANMQFGYQGIVGSAGLNLIATAGTMSFSTAGTSDITVNPTGTGNIRLTLAGASAGVGVNTAPNSILHVNGSFAGGYVAKTGTYTATISDYTIECTANTFTVTLPTAVGIPGRVYNIVNSGAGTITVGTTSSQTFVNVTATPTTLTLSAVGWYSVQSNGANWMVISN